MRRVILDQMGIRRLPAFRTRDPLARIAALLASGLLTGCWPTFDLYLGLPDVEADAVVVTSKTAEGHRAFGAYVDSPQWDWDVSKDSDLEAHYFSCSLDALGISSGELQPAHGPPTTYPKTVGSFARSPGEDDWRAIPSPTLNLGIDYEPCPVFEVASTQGLGFRRTLLWATRVGSDEILVGSADGVVRVASDGRIDPVPTNVVIVAAEMTPDGLLAVTTPGDGTDDFKTYRGRTIEALSILPDEVITGAYFSMEMAVRTTTVGYAVYRAASSHSFSAFDGETWNQRRAFPFPGPRPDTADDVFVVSSGDRVMASSLNANFVADLERYTAVEVGDLVTGLVHHSRWGFVATTRAQKLVRLDSPHLSTTIRGTVVAADADRLLLADRGVLSLLHQDGHQCEIGAVDGKVFRAFPTDDGFLVVSRSFLTNEAIVSLLRETEQREDCSR